jgi:gamma-glutamyltranspeptidase
VTSLTLHRPITLAHQGMVVAPHNLAAEAGLDLLKAGGNAIDAAWAEMSSWSFMMPEARSSMG